jgi:hypothetical protein
MGGGSKPQLIRVVGTLLWLLVTGLVVALNVTGCARVLPIEREMLSEPVMLMDSDPRERAHEQHWIETLEASTGGYGGAAGGCACY